MSLYITAHYGIYLHAIIEESHAALSVDLHLGYIFDPIPMVEGIRIQEGSLCMLSYALSATFVATFCMVSLVRGTWAPFFGAIPSLQFKSNFAPNAFTSGQS